MGIQLREYQNECNEKIRDSFRRGSDRVAAVLPTGSGKTTIFGSIVRDFLRKDKSGKVAIVSHLGLLTSQTTKRFKSEWGVSTGILQADRFPSKEARCIITTMQSFREGDKLLKWSRKIGSYHSDIDKLNIKLIIVDECHRMGSESYETILGHFPNAKVIGFTATPFRQNKLMTNTFDEVAYTISMGELIDLGYLVPPRLNIVPFDTTDPADMYSKIAHIYLEKHKGEKSVVYLKTIEECKLARNIFVDLGITCSAITAELTGDTRDKLLDDFRQGKGPDILTTVDVLTAGFDSPNLKSLFMPYKVGSVTTYMQRVGRGLRPYQNKTHCDIYAGSDSPGIEAGFWEKITKQILEEGRKRNYDDYLEILEFGENDFSKEQYEWTMDVVKMAKEVRSKGMETLFDMIVKKELPEEMLNLMIEHTPSTTKKNAKTPPTPKQVEFLKGINMYRIGVTKQEASAILLNYKKSKGDIPQDEMVPDGRHKGKHYSEVPPMYWFALKKYGKHRNSAAHKGWLKYKEKINGKSKAN